MNLRKRFLPDTDLELSVICLGTVPVGGQLSEDDSFRLLDAYVERGGNFIDTAIIYSDWMGDERALSEKRIGRWLRSRGVADRVTVATKGGHPLWGSLHLMRLSPEELRSDIAGSRDRLGLDTIPLYYLHRDDTDHPVSEIIDVLAEAVDAGHVRYLGCSNWAAGRIVDAQQYAAGHGRPGFVVNQPRWSLARVNPESQTIPGLVEMDDALHTLHLRTQLAAAPYSSQAQGFFSGRYGPPLPDLPADDKIRRYYVNDANLHKLERTQQLARKLGRPMTHVALAYLLAQPFAVFPIIGTSRVEHLDESLVAHDLELTPKQARWLETGLGTPDA